MQRRTCPANRSICKGGILSSMGIKINILGITKGQEQYVFLSDDESTAALLKVFNEFAGDSELSFSWYDAAFLSQEVRRFRHENQKSK